MLIEGLSVAIILDTRESKWQKYTYWSIGGAIHLRSTSRDWVLLHNSAFLLDHLLSELCWVEQSAVFARTISGAAQLLTGDGCKSKHLELHLEALAVSLGVSKSWFCASCIPRNADVPHPKTSLQLVQRLRLSSHVQPELIDLLLIFLPMPQSVGLREDWHINLQLDTQLWNLEQEKMSYISWPRGIEGERMSRRRVSRAWCYTFTADTENHTTIRFPVPMT
jgi:hypothetical protein